MVAWNLTPSAATVYSGPVRRRLERGQACWLQLGTLDLSGAWIQVPWAGSLSRWVVLAPPQTTIKIFRFAQNPQILRRCSFVGSAVCSAQHSQIWINYSVQRLGDLGLGFGLGQKTSCGSQWAWCHHRREERQRNLVETVWLFVRRLIPCVIQELLLWKAESH